MINIPIEISLEKLWGDAKFTKTEWGSLNLIVGPNGTGKSLFADQLKIELSQLNYETRLLNAERLSGFEKGNYRDFTGLVPMSDSFDKGFNLGKIDSLQATGESFGLSSAAFIILKERLDIRIKIEAILSDVFRKTIRLIEEGGFILPKIKNNDGGPEYNIKENESHGLKELITLLTFIYDESKDCIILDEPELHLHPQYQSFLLGEIKKFAGNPKKDSSKKIFFIITHSPYFLDFRSIDDLENILVCNYKNPPEYINSNNIEDYDKNILKKFLPRFNTHHKQLFFSPNPVFVEGHTDQQIITLLFDKLEYNIGASGSCIIDVGGKDELAVFYRLCKQLNINGIIIADLDALFKGKLRAVAQNDCHCNSYVVDNGLGINFSTLIGELQKIIKKVADDIVSKSCKDDDINEIILYLKSNINDQKKLHSVITSLMMSIIRFKSKIIDIVSDDQKNNVKFIYSRFYELLNALKTANIYILPRGEIEHYYTQTDLDYLNFSDKNNSFNTEIDFILSCNDKSKLLSEYNDLLQVLNESVPSIRVDLSLHLSSNIIEWIQKIQILVNKGAIKTTEELIANEVVNYPLFNQILDVEYLEVKNDKTFKCKIVINKNLSEDHKELVFSEKTIAYKFSL